MYVYSKTIKRHTITRDTYTRHAVPDTRHVSHYTTDYSRYVSHYETHTQDTHHYRYKITYHICVCNVIYCVIYTLHLTEHDQGRFAAIIRSSLVIKLNPKLSS